MLNADDKKIEWFKKARFGLFIHWGLYAATEGYWNGKETPGIGEWIAAKEKIALADYEKLAEKMTCEKFDAKKIAVLAKKAGMKYCVFTSKHHEGFAMYNTSYDDYSIVKRSPCKRDIVKEVTDAMREEGIVPCLYYSQALDFHEKDAMGNTWDFAVPEEERDIDAYLNGKCKYQLKELLTNYGDIGLVWMDVPNRMTDERTEDLKAYVKSFQPNCLISGRIGCTPNMGDFGCFGDNQIPVGKPQGCWETASTMNNTWGYKRDDKNFKSPKEIIELLCGLMSKGVNLLLNIGPKANGEIPEESIYILDELAEWYGVNGEAVDGTEASPFECDFTFGGASRKGNAIYLYIYDETEKIDIYGIKNKIKKISVLGGRNLEFENSDGLHFAMVKEDFGKYVTVVKIETDGIPEVNRGIYSQEKGTVILPASLCETVKQSNCETADFNEDDAAVAAEKYNLAAAADMSVSLAGVIEKWFDKRDYVKWTFETAEEGEYKAILYTLTQKYKPWTGGHTVKIVCGEKEYPPVVLKADVKSRGANKKYFSETGSVIGKIQLAKGTNNIKLCAENINPEDAAGIGVSKLLLIKNG